MLIFFITAVTLSLFAPDIFADDKSPPDCHDLFKQPLPSQEGKGGDDGGSNTVDSVPHDLTQAEIDIIRTNIANAIRTLDELRRRFERQKPGDVPVVKIDFDGIARAVKMLFDSLTVIQTYPKGKNKALREMAIQAFAVGKDDVGFDRYDEKDAKIFAKKFVESQTQLKRTGVFNNTETDAIFSRWGIFSDSFIVLPQKDIPL